MIIKSRMQIIKILLDNNLLFREKSFVLFINISRKFRKCATKFIYICIHNIKKSIMKKFLVAFICLTVGFSSCTKQDSLKYSIDENNCAIQIAGNQKIRTLYNTFFTCGHPASSCSGCIIVNGTPLHADCQGYGQTCTMSATLSVVSLGANLYTATTQDSTDLTSEEFFNMPERSLYTGLDNSGAPRWLNIPAQLSIRDSVTRLFTFNGVYFTQQQVYKNQ